MKKLKKILIISIVCILLFALSAYIYLRLTIPKTEGTIRVKGIDNEILIKRNQWGVPVIDAKSIEDMFFAIGFCHASDRLFQMDLSRRLSSGKLSEIFGEESLETDKYHKGLLIEESIEKSIKNVHPAMEKIIQSYCNGVNFFIETRKLPPEFIFLRYKPNPWAIKDIASIFKSMEIILTGSGSELYNSKLVRALGKTNAETFISGAWGTTIINKEEYDNIFKNQSLQTAFLNEINLMENCVGSNNWVISGEKTVTGSPILANDPHLSNIFPSYFYQLSAKTGDFALSGNTLPGIPFIIIGRNENIGWGLTNIGTDVIDYFILKINPENKNQYEWDGKWIDFDFIEKRIRVKGKEDYIHRVKVSRLGPVYEENGKLLAMHSIGKYQSTILESFYKMNFATNINEFLKGLKYFSSPAQNVVFADRKGNIGYFPTGLIPKRRKGNGEVPLPAVKSSDGWDGFYSEDEKPYLLNPQKGYIVTANNPVLPDECLPIFSKRWFPSFRADRIDELIVSKSKLSMEDNRGIQTDIFLKSAEFLIGKIKDFAFDSEEANFVLNYLKKWNFKVDRGLSPYLFYRFEFNLAHNIFNDNVKEEKYLQLISTRWIYKIMNYPQKNGEVDNFSYFVDNLNTPRKEVFKETVEKSLKDTYDEYMEKSKKGNLDWQEIHTLEYKHPLGRVAILKTFLNKGPFGMEGGRDCIMTSSFRRNRNFNVVQMCAFRMIMDFSDFSNSILINSSGQSGHFMSGNYDDQIELYTNLRYRKMEDFSSKLRILKLLPNK